MCWLARISSQCSFTSKVSLLQDMAWLSHRPGVIGWGTIISMATDGLTCLPLFPFQVWQHRKDYKCVQWVREQGKGGTHPCISLGLLLIQPFTPTHLMLKICCDSCETSYAPLVLHRGQAATGKSGVENPRNFTDLKEQISPKIFPWRGKPMPYTKYTSFCHQQGMLSMSYPKDLHCHFRLSRCQQNEDRLGTFTS